MKKTVCFALLLSMLLALTACGGTTPTQAPSANAPTENPATPAPSAASTPEATQEPVADGPQYGGIVKVIDTGANGGTAEPFGFPWTPIMAKNYATPWSETLVLYTQDGIYEPHLAIDWEIDVEALTIKFVLREGVFFTDGSPLNAEAVVWNINRWKVDGRGNAELDYAELIDEYSLIVYYKNWQNVLFEAFASHTYSVVSMQNALDNGAEYAMNHPVGTGPFILSDWVPGSHVKFVRNEDYWMEGKPYLDGVEYYEISDIMTQNATLLSNSDDSMDMYQCGNAEQAYAIMSQDNELDSSYMRGGGTMTICPSSVNEDSPHANLLVRQAMSYAIDRDAIVEAKGFGIMQPAYQITAKGFAGHLPDDNPNLATYDPDKAKDLMIEAGYPDGFTTTLYAAPSFQDFAVIVQDQLEVIGIQVELEFPEPGRLSDLQKNGWEGLLVVSFGQVMNTGISYRIWYNPNNEAYVSAYRPPEYEDMFFEARRSFDIDNELFGRLGNLVLEYMTFIPIYHINSVYFVRNGLMDHGYHTYSADTIWTPWDAYWEAGSPKLG